MIADQEPDRRMVEVRTSSGSLYLYTHLDGAQMPHRARVALDAARPYWYGGRCDESYATHILLDHLLKPGRDRLTDYGVLLTPSEADDYNGGQPSVVIDLPQRTLVVIPSEGVPHPRQVEAAIAFLTAPE